MGVVPQGPFMYASYLDSRGIVALFEDNQGLFLDMGAGYVVLNMGPLALILIP